jgi:hypothetical protein
VLLVLRFARAVAGVREHVPSDHEEEVAMAADCANPDCANTASSAGEGLCYVCAGTFQRDKNELFADLDKVLSLEAQFVEFCAARGLPNPHE